MSLLSIAVPSYNAQDYLHRCLDSLVPFGDDLDIIVINDGSTDETSAIAHRYADAHPNITVIDQANGGHGAGINAGLKAAQSPYFKVVDSDDRVDQSAMKTVLDALRTYVNAPSEAPTIDLVLTNYVCEVHHQDGHVTHSPISFKNVFHTDRVMTWQDLGHLKFNQLIQMHSIIYRTQMLREINLELPRKVFYEDNLYVYKGLPHVKHFVYLDVDLYLYYIGRPDQSIHFSSLVKNVHMTIAITNDMIDIAPTQESTYQKKLHQYMIRHLLRMFAMCHLTASMSDDPSVEPAIQALEAKLNAHDTYIYRRIIRSPMLIGIKCLKIFGQSFNRKFYTWLGKTFKFSQ